MSEDDRPCHCDECEEIAALRAQLSVAEKERDIERSRANDARDKMYNNVAGLNAALTRVKALEAALEPTPENVRAIAVEMADDPGEAEWWDDYAVNVLDSIRIRAGLTKEGG